MGATSLDEDWQLAAADAGIDPSIVLLYPLESCDEYGASYYHPGLAPYGHDRSFTYTDDDLSALRDMKDRHVIVVDREMEGPRRLLVLRHEAQHVAQYQASATAGAFALQLAAAREPDWLYLAMPHERDADAAATAFRLARRIEPSEDDRVGRDRMLYEAPWSEPDNGSLPIRLLAFSLFYADDFDLACTSSQYWPAVDPAELTDAMIPGGASARAKLRDSVAGFLSRVTDHGISRDEWDRMTRPERNAVTDRLRAEVVQREAQLVRQILAEL